MLGLPVLHRFWIEIRGGVRVVVKERVLNETQGWGGDRDWWPLDTDAGRQRLADEQVPLDALEDL